MRILNDGSTVSELAALGILNEYFAHEERGTDKAFVLHKEFSRRMPVGVILTDEMVSTLVAEILVAAKLSLDRTAGRLELVSGHRRDTLRG